MQKKSAITNYAADIAIFANPDFDGELVLEKQVSPGGISGLRNWSANLKPLPWTAAEANRLSQNFLPGRTLVYTERKATRANLHTEPVRNSRILHIATHGYFRDENPDNVGFILSMIDENGHPDPGFITLTELFTTRFNNELVVISGCDTALGRQLDGEGMMGLSKGFLSQGARHVISTLWPVEDKVSADFMGIFYRQLKQHQSVSEALRASQLELRSNDRYRKPFYWAPYVLHSVSKNDQITL